jgi:hypothetical protein
MENEGIPTSIAVIVVAIVVSIFSLAGLVTFLVLRGM